MAFLIVSFIAGILTVLAPCILPVLPVIIGSSASGRSKNTPYVVVASLSVSIILFTYLLKASTAFIMIPPEVWTYLSGGIILFFGATLLAPSIWDRIPGMVKLSQQSNVLVGQGYQKKSVYGDVLIGAALGPVFSTCSPTYFVILASVLPAKFILGTTYLLAYVAGLALVLLLIALLGERFASKLTAFSDPKSWFKKILGILFIVLGVLIATGYEKKIETAILDAGYLDITKFEQRLIENSQSENTPSEQNGIPYIEIVNPSGFVNTNDEPVKIGDYVGEKVILLDIMTYSCINCQRTFPYVTSWYEKYKDDGFIVIGIHTPEFAFEKDKKNVEEAMKEFGIEFPVVLDNDYSTWNAYGNRYWPRKYLIDIHGNIVYDHIGEGAYEETEEKIVELLNERAEVLGEAGMDDVTLVSSGIEGVRSSASSPETYFGSLRNEYLANGLRGVSGIQKFTLPSQVLENRLYLAGTWNILPEFAASVTDAKVLYKYNAKEVYIVADADKLTVEVWQDGKLVGTERGADVSESGIMKVQESRLYKIIRNDTAGVHTLELRVRGGGARFYAFTFG